MRPKKPRSRGKKDRPPQNLKKFEKGPYVSKGSMLLEKEFRASLVSMEVFARRIGVHRVSVFRWISGKVRPDRDNIFLMEKRFGIPARAWTIMVNHAA